MKRNEAQAKQRKSKPEARQLVFNRFNDKPHFLCDCSHFKPKKVIAPVRCPKAFRSGAKESIVRAYRMVVTYFLHIQGFRFFSGESVNIDGR